MLGIVLFPHFAFENGINLSLYAFQVFFAFGRVERLHTVLAETFTSKLAVENFSLDMFGV